MMACPTPDEIEFKWRASGTGICIVVEGETEMDDAWFYSQWFSDRARQITFFPQDGWEKVMVAVENLRARLGAKRVYGIVDRDFEGTISLEICPADGILRTPKYTLENYLLNPEGWFKYVHPHTGRASKPGWNTLEEARATIESFYRQCVPLSAYNWSLRQMRAHSRAEFEILPDADRQYREHPRAMEQFIHPQLRKLYDERLRILQEMSLAELEQVVSGKYVLKFLRANFPLGRLTQQAWDGALSFYMTLHSDPPDDLAAMIGLILQDAHS